MRLGVIRIQFECARQLGGGLFVTTSQLQHPSDVGVHDEREGVQIACDGHLPQGLVEPPLRSSIGNLW